MNKIAIPSVLAGSAAAFLILTGSPALAQMQIFPPGTDCSKLPETEQTDCHVLHGNSSMPSPPSPVLTLPGENGTGTDRNGALSPNGSAGQNNGGGNSSSSGASQAGQSNN